MKLRKAVATAGWLMLFGGWANAQTAPTQESVLTLDEAFRRAMGANMGVAHARTAVEAAEAQRRAIRSAVFPRLGLNGSAIRNTEEVSFGGGSDARTILPQPLYFSMG